MKNTFYFLAIATILSISFACHKDPLSAIPDDQARMYGKILEKGTKKPVKGAKVFLRNCSCIPFGGCACSVIDSVTTDDTGKYTFTYKYDGFSGSSFDIFIKVPKGFLAENSAIALAPTTHDIVNLDIDIQALAWIKIHLKNNKPFDMYDKAWISGGWSGGSHDNIYYGKDVDVLFVKEVIGNDSLGVGWSITKNNNNVFFTKRMFPTGRDTTKFEILY